MYGDSISNPYSSSDIYSTISSDLAAGVGGCGGQSTGTRYFLGGGNPVDGTYNCTLLNVVERNSFDGIYGYITKHFARVSITKIA